MSAITRWIEEQRRDRSTPLSKEAAEHFSKVLYRTLAKRLRRRISPEFGLPTAKEMASEQVAHLLKRLDEDGLGLPPFIKDSKSLFYWMYRTAWRRFLDRLEQRASRLPEHGLSGAPLLPDGSTDPLGMQNVQARPYRGDALVVEELGVEEVESLMAALDDSRRWFAAEASHSKHSASPGKDWAFTFEQVVLEGHAQEEVAAEVKIAAGNVGRWLDRTRFCILRRSGYERDQLVKWFGEAEVKRWTISLEAALSRNA